MINLSYTVAGQLIEPASVPQYLVADTVGVYQVAFTFDADWADMGEKTVVFRNPQVIDPDYRDVPVEFPLDANGQALVPAALLDPGKLFIGVYGTNSTQQLPTIWAPPLQVVPGASPGVEPSDDPALGTVIRTIPQTLTEEEKAQARENIGANEVPGGTPGNLTSIDNNLNIADSGISKDNLILAPQLSSHIYAENQTPYLYRQTGGGVEAGTREYDSIVGGSVVYNQLVGHGNFVTATGWAFSSGGTFSVSNNVGIITCTSSVVSTSSFYTNTANRIANHRYYYHAEIKEPVQNSTQLQVNGVYNSILASANTWVTYDGFVKPSANGSGEVRFYFNRSNALASGDVVNIKNVMLIDVTKMFGSTVADALTVDMMKAMFGIGYLQYSAPSLESVSGLQSHKTVGWNRFDGNFEVGGLAWASGAEIVAPTSRRTDYIPVFADTPYYLASYYGVGICWYDSAKTYIRATLPGKDVISTSPTNAAYARLAWTSVTDDSPVRSSCFSVSDPSRNGTYEPYEEHTYPLDSSLTLRGVAVIDDNGNIRFDGDTYAPDGTVTRKYGIVDLGTLTWSYTTYSGIPRFYTTLGDAKKPSASSETAHAICPNYVTIPQSDSWVDGILCITTAGQLNILDATYSSAVAFKAAMNGVKMVYELATPTTETASPYDALQICDPLGTEEYVTTGIVPVGHETRYPEDSVKKLSGLPSDFSTLIAPTEVTYKATRAYTTGRLLIVNNILYKATTSIASGATLTVGTNIVAITLDEVIASL